MVNSVKRLEEMKASCAGEAAGLELPGGTELADYPYRRHSGALLSSLLSDMRLGHGRKAEFRFAATLPDEGRLPATLLFDAKPHARLLLRCRAGRPLAAQSKPATDFEGVTGGFED